MAHGAAGAVRCRALRGSLTGALLAATSAFTAASATASLLAAPLSAEAQANVSSLLVSVADQEYNAIEAALSLVQASSSASVDTSTTWIDPAGVPTAEDTTTIDPAGVPASVAEDTTTIDPAGVPTATAPTGAPAVNGSNVTRPRSLGGACGSNCFYYDVGTDVGSTRAAALFPGAMDVTLEIAQGADVIELSVPSRVLVQAAGLDGLAVAAYLTVLGAPFPETSAASAQVSVGVVSEVNLSGVWTVGDLTVLSASSGVLRAWNNLSGALLKEPVDLTLLKQKEDGVECAIWDNSQGAWSSGGVEEVIHNGSELICRTYYTGIFTALLVEAMNATDDDDRCERVSVLTQDALQHALQDGDWLFGLPGLLFLTLLLVTLVSVVLACRVDAQWTRRYPGDSRPLFVGSGGVGDRRPGSTAYLCEQLTGPADPVWTCQDLTYHALAYEEHVEVGTVRAIAEGSRWRGRTSCGTGRTASSVAAVTAPVHGAAAWEAIDQLVRGPEAPQILSKRALSVCDAFWCSNPCWRLCVVFLALSPLLRWRRYSMFVRSQTRLLVVAGEVFGSLVAIVLCLGDGCESGVRLQDIGVGLLCAILSVLTLVPVQLVLLLCGLACWQPGDRGPEELYSKCCICLRPLETATEMVLVAYLFFCALYAGLFIANALPAIRTRVAISCAGSVLGIVGLFPFLKAVFLLAAAALHQRRTPGSLSKVRDRLQRHGASNADEWTSVAVTASLGRLVEPEGSGGGGEAGDQAGRGGGDFIVEPGEPREEELQDKLEAAAARARNASAALHAMAGAGMGAKAKAAQVSSQCSPGQIEGFMAVVERQWSQKGRTLAQELCENLRQPKGGRAPGLPVDAELAGALADLPVDVAFLSLRTLAAVCRCAQEKYGSKPLNEELQGHLLSICCWVVYTMQDVDIDRLFGFSDCPVLPPGMEEPALRDAAYSEYRARCNGDRCPQMFSAANWAARVCFDKGGDVSTKAGQLALAGVQTWVKWLCFLGASARDLEAPVTVTRGLCGLPDQLVDDFRRKQAGDCIFWAAPSSTTDDASISDSYCNQQEPRERNVLFTISGVTQAFPMFELSQYPKEREWLLPPFCQLRVDRVVDGAPVQVECTFVGCMLSDLLRERVVRDFKQASQDLGRVLATMEEELSALREKLSRAIRRRPLGPVAVHGDPAPEVGGRLQQVLQEARRARGELQASLDAATARSDGRKASLERAAGAGMGAKIAAAEVSSQSSVQQVEDFMALVEQQWGKKERTLLQELCGNLRQPKGAPAMPRGQTGGIGETPVEAEALTLRTLAEVCFSAQEKYGSKLLNEELQGHLLSICCWVVYTMQDVDIDRLFGFPDCPVLPPGMEEPALRDAVYNEYRARCNGDRCPQMFSAANWAARVCFDKGGDVSTKAGQDALAGVQTWVKWLCFLGASARDLEAPVTVTRGLCGLPDQLVDDFRRMQAGDCIFWAAPSSTTDDASISDSYCNQQEPRERNVLFTISGVTQAFPMFELSQYPKEREWLLPPFCQLRVDRVVDGAPVQVECTFVGCMLSGLLRERVVRDFKQASQDLGRVLATMEEELSALRKQLEQTKRRGHVCAKAVFRICMLFLSRRPSDGGTSPLEDLLHDFRSRAGPAPRGPPPRLAVQLQASLDAATAQAEDRAASLESTVGASLGAKNAAAEVSGHCSRQQVDAFMELLERQWKQKDLTLLQEMCSNLRQPKGALGMPGRQTGSMGEAPVEAEAVTLRTLAEVCSCVRDKYARKPLNEQLQGHLLSMCCWAVYTMQDADIDRLFGFPDCPVLPPGMEEPALRDAAYNEYRARCGGDRCPQMFSAANWAARVCFDTSGDASSEVGRDALAGVQRWVKWLCFLGASAKDLEEPVTVTRGLCGLPEQLVNDFRGKRAGDCIFWAAPASTTDDAGISDSYCNQQEPRERNVLFTISGVTQAFPMFELSKYPREREWLLPPCCELWVNRVVDGAPVRVECTFVGCMLPGTLRERALRDLERASQDLCGVLATAKEELSTLRRQLAEARQHSVAMEGRGLALPLPHGQNDQQQGDLDLEVEDLRSEPDSEQPLELRLSASGPPMHVYRPSSASRARQSRTSDS